MENTWATKYEIGHDRIDFEHKIFFDLIRIIDREAHNKNQRDRISRFLRELIAYAQFHFISEENIMCDIGFPELKAHAEHHLDIIDKLHNKVLAYEMNEDTVENIVHFLDEWFVAHTQNEDIEIIKFISNNA